MGPAFVAIFWGCVATALGVVLCSITLAGSSTTGHHRRRRAAFWFCVPFTFLVWAAPAFVLYRLWAAVTGLETSVGATDYWTVSLPNNYALEFIDTETDASLVDSSDRVLVGDVTRIEERNGLVFGNAEDSGFVLNTITGTLQRGSQAELFARHGLDSMQLREVGRFTMGREPIPLDPLLLLLLVFGIPIGALVLIWRRLRSSCWL